MSRWLAAALALASSVALAGGPKDVVNADKIVWLGVDYTQARFISTTDFADEEQVAQHFPASWNGLVVEELPEKMAAGLGKTVDVDIAFMAEHNKACTTGQIVREEGGSDQTHLSPEAVAGLVKTWNPSTTSGVGMGIVVDRLVKMEEQGCVWLAFVDLGSKDLLYTERFCEAAAGFGFRNYWFRPVKTVLVEELKPVMKKLKKM